MKRVPKMVFYKNTHADTSKPWKSSCKGGPCLRRLPCRPATGGRRPCALMFAANNSRYTNTVVPLSRKIHDCQNRMSRAVAWSPISNCKWWLWIKSRLFLGHRNEQDPAPHPVGRKAAGLAGGQRAYSPCGTRGSRRAAPVRGHTEAWAR